MALRQRRLTTGSRYSIGDSVRRQARQTLLGLDVAAAAIDPVEAEVLEAAEQDAVVIVDERPALHLRPQRQPGGRQELGHHVLPEQRLGKPLDLEQRVGFDRRHLRPVCERGPDGSRSQDLRRLQRERPVPSAEALQRLPRRQQRWLDRQRVTFVNRRPTEYDVHGVTGAGGEASLTQRHRLSCHRPQPTARARPSLPPGVTPSLPCPRPLTAPLPLGQPTSAWSTWWRIIHRRVR